MKDAYYFRHDYNARHDPKCQALIEKYGVEGYGRYWILIEVLRESSHYRISEKPMEIRSLAAQFKIDIKSTKEFLQDCVSEFELLEKEDGYYFSASLLKRMTHLDDIRVKRRAAALQRYYDD